MTEDIDTSVAHPARRYNYWLGGSVHFEADRVAADAMAAAYPSIKMLAIENRRFLRRAVKFLVEEAGVDQFLDIGTGIPSPGGLEELAPEAKILHVDNDPIVRLHAGGLEHYLEADLMDPQTILKEARKVLDLRRPVALMLVCVLHFLRDEHDPYAHVAKLVRALPSGSYLTISHATSDYVEPRQQAALAEADSRTKSPAQVRSRAEVARFLHGLELTPPGLVSLAEWRAEFEPRPRPAVADIACYGGVARVR